MRSLRAPDPENGDGRESGAQPGYPGQRVAGNSTGWYARNVDSTSGIGDSGAGPWYRVQAITAVGGGTAEQDYASVLPAALNAALRGRPFVAGWLSRGGGAPLELISNAGPLPAARAQDRGVAAWPSAGRAAAQHGIPPASAAEDPGRPHELLFPWGARGVRLPGSLLADLDRLVWAPCPGRQALPLGAGPGDQAGPRQPGRESRTGQRENGAQRDRNHDNGQQPTLFESALTTLIGQAVRLAGGRGADRT